MIVAGGSGTRMNSAVPKQFLELQGLPVLMHTLQAFYRCDQSIIILLVLPSAQISYWQELVQTFNFHIPHEVVAGGDSRFQSVKNGLNVIKGDGLVAVHDGVRPLVSSRIINEAFQVASRHGAAITVVPSKDSIRVKTKDGSHSVDRSRYLLVQTPQTFRVDEIKAAYEQRELPEFTDDASVYEYGGKKVTLVEGSYKNLKITTPEDLLIAEALL